jgi:hypothetical protein
VDALRPGGVTFCAERLAGAGCELEPKIEQDGGYLCPAMDYGGLIMIMTEG